jgi:hypothetical protein
MRVYSFECDGCGALEDATPLPDRHPLRKARREIADRGWKYVDGKDLCPCCASKEA